MNKSKQQLTNNILSLGLVQIANYLLPLLSVPIVSRILGPEKFGVINFAAAFIAYFNIIITYSFDFTATRRIAKDPENEELRNLVFSEIFFTRLWLFFISSIIFVAMLFTLPAFKEIKIVLIFSYFLCFGTLFTQNWLFQAMQELSKIALLNFISKIVFTVAILIAVQQEDDYIWQPFLIGCIQSGVAILSFFWAIKKFKIKLVGTPIMKCLKVLHQDRVMFISLIFVSFYTYTNTIILGFFQDSKQVGYYSAAQRLIIIAQSVLAMPLAQAFYPFIGKAFAESRESGLRIAQKLVSLVIVFVGLASIAMFVFGPIVLKLFYGNKFEGAIPAFLILVLVPLLYTLNNILGVHIMINLGMDKSFLRISAIAAAFSIILNVFLIQRLGYIGSAINWLLTELFLLASMSVILKRQNLNPFNKHYFSITIIGEHFKPLKKRLFPNR